MNKGERRLATRLNEFRYIFLATTCLMLLLAACRSPSSPITLPPTPAFASTAVATVFPGVVIPEPTAAREAPLPQVDRFFIGSSSFKDIADWLYRQPNTIRDDQTMNEIGNSANETDVYNLNVEDTSLYVYGQFGGMIEGKGGALQWLQDFNLKRVPINWQPKEIDNLWGSEYRYAENEKAARASAKNMTKLINVELDMYPNSKVNIHFPFPVVWEDPKNREAYSDELIIWLREKRKVNPTKYSRVHMYSLDSLVMLDGRINPNAFRQPEPGERGLTHLKRELTPDLLETIIKHPYEIIW